MAVPRIDGLTGLEEIGRGGFGVVYRADDRSHARSVAVKLLRENLDETGLARFERECRAAGSLSGHPNIVSFHGSGITEAGEPYFVMDLLVGGSLADRVAETGPLDAAATVDLGVGLAGALAAAHAHGIIHRDLKPENVLFSAFGVPQLVDFGIARMVSEFETRTGSISASLAHAPPEVIAGAPPSPQGDLYSLASVLFFALTGAAPFTRPDEETLAPLIARITTEPPPDLGDRGVPAALAAIIEQGLAKDPADRAVDAATFGEQLRSVASELGLPVPSLVLASDVVPSAGPSRWSTPRRESDDRPGAGPNGDVTIDVSDPEVVAAPAVRSDGRRRRVGVAALAIGALVASALVGWSTLGREAAVDQVPAAPTKVQVRRPLYLGDDADRVSVQIQWKAPADAGEITGYRIRHRQRWKQGNGCPKAAGTTPATVIEVATAVTSTQYSDTEKACGWVVWEVAAVNAAGVGPYATAHGVVPDVEGLDHSFHLVRAVGGLASGTTPQDCGVAASLACLTSPSAGTVIDPGTIVAIAQQQEQ